MYTSKQRVMMAANHRRADRVPITFDAEPEIYEALHKHLHTGSKEQLFDKLNVDTWMLMPNEKKTSDEQNREVSIWGYKLEPIKYSGGEYNELCFSPLAGADDISDIKKHKWPTAEQMDFSEFAGVSSRQPDRAVIGCFTWGAYFLATYIRGMENLMMDFALRKDYAEYLINTIADRVLMYLDKMLEEQGDEIDIVYMADDYCMQQSPLFSADMFKVFVQPYLTKAVEKVHKHNKKFLLHCCGAVRPLLPLIIDSGVDMLEPIQIRATGMEPEGLKKDFGKDLCFYGGVDLQQILCKGTPQVVADEVKRLIDILGKDGGYILGPGHTYIQVDAPIENILAMYETAASYRY